MSVRRHSRLWSRIGSEFVAAVLLAAVSADAQTQQSAKAAVQPPLRTPQQAPQPPIAIDAAFSRVDYNTNTVIFRKIVVSQGDTHLTAERAHAAGVGFANTEWTFEDSVVIDVDPRGTLRCDRAVVTFRESRITVATATGGPAQFEQRGADARPAAHGSADRIVYDAQENSVRLSGNAHFTDSRGLTVSGPVLLYDIRNERLQAASPGESRGVHITVPEAQSQSGQPSSGPQPRR